MLQYKLQDAVVEVTHKCNLSCLHCGSGCNETTERGNELSTDEWIDFIEQFHDIGAQRVFFSGGEPTLKPGFCELLRTAYDCGLHFGFITNGFHFQDDLLETMESCPPTVVGISIDGSPKVHNHIRRNSQSFRRVLKVVGQLQERNIDICAVTTVNRFNWNILPTIGNLLNLADIGNWQIQIAMPFGRLAEHREWLIDEDMFKKICDFLYHFRREYPHIQTQAADCFAVAPAGAIRNKDWNNCGAGTSGIGVDSEGNVLPCLSWWSSDFICGNLRNKSLKSIWETSSGFDFNRKFDPNAVKGQNCVECELLSDCRGGCASLSFAFTGKLHNSPFCYFRSYQ